MREPVDRCVFLWSSHALKSAAIGIHADSKFAAVPMHSCDKTGTLFAKRGKIAIALRFENIEGSSHPITYGPRDRDEIEANMDDQDQEASERGFGTVAQS